MSQPIIQQSTLDLLKEFEGVKHQAYKDSAGLWTTGVGHLIKPNEQSLVTATLTDEDVDRILTADSQVSSNFVRNHCYKQLTQNQFDALNSFTFNLGTGALASSTLLKNINNGTPVEEHHFTDWDKVHLDGKLVEIAGLKFRRQKEYKIFIS